MKKIILVVDTLTKNYRTDVQSTKSEIKTFFGTRCYSDEVDRPVCYVNAEVTEDDLKYLHSCIPTSVNLILLNYDSEKS